MFKLSDVPPAVESPSPAVIAPSSDDVRILEEEFAILASR